jgi:hypothetical protein
MNEAKLPLHNGVSETNCIALGDATSASRALRLAPDDYLVFAAGVSAPGGLSGASGGGEALLSGGVPLSGVVLPLTDAPDGSVGGGALEPPHATEHTQPSRTTIKPSWGRCMGAGVARLVPRGPAVAFELQVQVQET